MHQDRDRLVERLDRMLEAGRVTPEEAERVRQAADSDQFDEAVRAVRLRHATERLDAAVDDGQITPEEAAALRERLKNGEDARVLRGLRRGASFSDRASQEREAHD